MRSSVLPVRFDTLHRERSAYLLLELLVLGLLLLLVVLDFLLRLASCVLYSLCAVFNG